MKLKKKFYLPVLILLVCAAFYLLLPHVISIYLQHTLRQQFQTALEVGKINKEGDKWVLKDIYLLKENEKIVFIPKIILTPSVSLFKREISLDWKVLDPEIYYEKIEGDRVLNQIRVPSNPLISGLHFFKVYNHFAVDKGFLVSNESKYTFSLEGNFKKCHFIIWANPTSFLKGFFSKEELDLNFENFIFQNETIISKVNGSFKGALNTLQVDANLTLENLQVKNLNVEAAFPKIQFSISKNFLGNVSILEPANIKFSDIKIDNFHGDVNFNKAVSHFSFIGKVEQDEQFLDFQWGGRTHLDKAKNFNILSELSFIDKGGKEEKAALNFSFIEPSTFDCKGVFNQINLDHPFWKKALKSQRLEIDEGLADLTFYAFFDNFALKALKGDKIEVTDLKATLNHLPITIDHLQGDFFVDDKLFSGKLNLENGACLDGDETFSLDCLFTNGALSLFNLKIASNDFTLLGKNLDHENITLELKGKMPQRFSRYLEKNDAAGFSNDLVDGLSLLHIDKGQFNLLGVVNWNHDPIYFDLKFLNDFSLDNGYIAAQNLKIQHYFLPLIPELEKIGLKGLCNCEAFFDAKSLFLNYEAKKITVENSLFECAFQDENVIPGLHYIDFTAGRNSGLIFLNKVSFLEKKNGLSFSEVNSQISVGKDHLFALNCSAYCEEIFFSGDLRVNYKPNDSIAAIFQFDEMNGNVSDLSKIVKSFDRENVLVKLPIQGLMELSNQTSFLSLNATPEDMSWKAFLKGSVVDGQLSKIDNGLKVQDIFFDFEFDSQKKLLNLTDLQGSLFVNSHHKVEEFLIGGDLLKLEDLKSDFDVWVGDKNRDILRVAGKGKATDHGLEFSFDNEKSHFSNVHPENFSFSISNDNRLENLHFNCHIDLKAFLSDLKRLLRTNFVEANPLLKDALEDVRIGLGNFKIDLTKENRDENLKFHITGNEIILDDRKIEHFLLMGQKKNKQWIVDELVLDKLSFSCEMSFEDHFWDIHFLGAKMGDDFLGGFSGKYYPHLYHFVGNIDLIEIDLRSLGEYKFLEKTFSLLRPSGLLKGHGNLEIEKLDSRDFGYHLYIESEGKNLSLNDLSLNDIQNFSLTFNDHSGLSIDNLKIVSQDQLLLDLPKIQFNIARNELIIDPFAFYLDDQLFKRLLDEFSLKENYPFEKIFFNQRLEGIGTFKRKKNSYFLDLETKDQAHMSFHYDPLEVVLQYENPCHTFLVQSDDFFATGRSYLKDKLSNENLHVSWNKKGKAFEIIDLEGSFKNVKLTLKKNVDQLLEGHIFVPLLKGSLNFLGQCIYDANGLNVSGNLEGQNLNCKNYSLPSLKSDFEYKNGKTIFKNVDIQEENFHLTTLEAQLEDLEFKIPLLKINRTQPIYFYNFFTISSLEMENFHGDLSNLSSWVGQGKTCFEMKPLEDIKTLIPIPESLSQIDLKALWPIKGTAFFKLEDSKILLEKLSDTLSQDNLSKFYLSKSEKSSIHLDSSLKIFLKTKQNNLLFKVAEMFTLKIDGSLQQPRLVFEN
jgi:hypothetical protein